ncbi:hypothetical protein [Vibrio alginolyticus]|uniref:hypothetical protein n=1 Tax=Vibrio alginolyticus TaxID=663 RepID=UPI0010BD859F|nr:hypothetical protein [Vibrio alginolyticus]TKF04886.1 hypothetical protein FCV48_21795 [Vibrio alginolyticus]
MNKSIYIILATLVTCFVVTFLFIPSLSEKVEYLNSLGANNLTIVSIVVSAVGVILSALLAIFGIGLAAAQYSLKSSVKVSSSFSYKYGCERHSTYITSVTLTNQKDKSEAIYGIYLELGHGVYVELENLRHKPLVIGAFETIVRNYNPVSFYGCNGTKVNIGENLDRYPRVNIVLSTNHGKYLTIKDLNRWNPISENLHKGTALLVVPERHVHDLSDEQNNIIPNNTVYILSYKKNNNSDFDYITRANFLPENLGTGKYFLKKEHENDPKLLLEHLKGLSHLQLQYKIDVSSIKVHLPKEQESVIGLDWFYADSLDLEPTSWWDIYVVARLKRKFKNLTYAREDYNRTHKNFGFIEIKVLRWFTIAIFIMLLLLAVSSEI